jgi:alkylation response protein AidB-like acyl-CoA dehydrogenase
MTPKIATRIVEPKSQFSDAVSSNPEHPMSSPLNLPEAIDALVPVFRERSVESDQTDRCAEENIRALRTLGVYRAQIPAELGGLDLPHAEMCDLLRRIAHGCPSTALTTSMHQHLVAVEVWKVRNGKSDGATLRAVAENDLMLVSTGAKDWIGSNSELTATDGGYLLNGKKSFASGSAIGDKFITSAIHGDEVFHFAVAFDAEGVSVKNEWFSTGMRGTGSDTILLEDVFVPEEAIALRRPRGEWHPVWSLVATKAMPLIVAVYVGIAERARDKALELAAGKEHDSGLFQQIGELERSLTATRVAFESMIAIAGRDGMPNEQDAADILARKTLAIESCIETVERALEMAGGFGYLRRSGFEQLHRDALAGRHHPLPARRQAELSGRLALGLSPIE